jgi:hypothetical protein
MDGAHALRSPNAPIGRIPRDTRGCDPDIGRERDRAVGAPGRPGVASEISRKEWS